jgi:hypothetical protein
MLKCLCQLEIDDQTREYRCTAHEVFEIAASLAMGRTAMRTIAPRLHLGHWSGSIPERSRYSEELSRRGIMAPSK